MLEPDAKRRRLCRSSAGHATSSARPQGSWAPSNNNNNTLVHAPSPSVVAHKWRQIVGAFPQLEKVFFQRKASLEAAAGDAAGQPQLQQAGEASSGAAGTSGAAGQEGAGEGPNPNPAGAPGAELPAYLTAFAEDLSSFSRYQCFELRGEVKCSDLLNTANMVCSTAFDR